MINWKEIFRNKERQDFYLVYDLSQNEIKKVRDKWFIYEYVTNKTNDIIYTDSLITIKRCDEESSCHLYNHVYNPVSLNIMCPLGAKFEKDDKGNLLHNMKAAIYSIDDSSYGIWFDKIPLDKLIYIRKQIMEYIDTLSEINGEELLEYCLTLGANPETKDYN